jgi:hypothetical protein
MYKYTFSRTKTTKVCELGCYRLARADFFSGVQKLNIAGVFFFSTLPKMQFVWMELPNYRKHS